MSAFLDFMVMLGGLAAAAAVGGMCVVVLFVWIAGGPPKGRSEAWRPADEL